MVTRSRGRASLPKFFAISLATTLVGVFAVNSAGADTPERGQVEVLELDVRNDQYADTDLDPKGPSLGDAYVYSGTAMKDGSSVGRGGGSCQVVHIKGEELTTQCLITIELDRGSLTMQSLWVSGTKSLDMAITGGTGDFSNARGTAHYRDIATPKERVRAEIQH
ncbi:dirigent protein [Streptomyces boluensis]|uniref:Dirigent protein n=1 Tax=Streptomyces boluensis TaxID=1775135 RepID=A0A964UTG7_9ACTN|nr:dirigent protein [Streptomyces boluensis]NBE51360.1 dirigent protein [Streptomyces boluensis]